MPGAASQPGAKQMPQCHGPAALQLCRSRSTCTCFVTQRLAPSCAAAPEGEVLVRKRARKCRSVYGSREVCSVSRHCAARASSQSRVRPASLQLLCLQAATFRLTVKFNLQRPSGIENLLRSLFTERCVRRGRQPAQPLWQQGLQPPRPAADAADAARAQVGVRA